MITTIEKLVDDKTFPQVTTPLKPIEFVKCVNEVSQSFGKALFDPTDWENIILLKRGTIDVMYAFDTSRPHDGCVYIGHWNDGVKE